MKSKWLLALALAVPALAFSVSGADLHVPEEIIGAETAAILNLNVNKIKPDQLAKSIGDISGKPIDPKDVEQMKQFTKAFADLGGVGVSVVVSVSKDVKAQSANPGDGVLLVVEMKDAAAADNLAKFFADIPGLKEQVAADCPKSIGGKLVWYGKNSKLPAANADRAQLFVNAQYEVSDETSIALIFVPGENTHELAKTSLPPEQAKVAEAILGGSGIALFSNFGVADAPTIKLLFMAADAGGADTIHKTLQGLIDEVKKGAPPEAKNLVDALKADAVGSNVQLSVGIVDWAKVVLASMGMK